MLIRAALSTLCLLVSVAPASAECAWVLWREDETKADRLEITWAVPVAYSDRGACVAVINGLVKEWEKRRAPNQTVEPASSGTSAEFRTRFKGGDGWISRRLHCLPDTVDPRGPKGNK